MYFLENIWFRFTSDICLFPFPFLLFWWFLIWFWCQGHMDFLKCHCLYYFPFYFWELFERHSCYVFIIYLAENLHQDVANTFRKSTIRTGIETVIKKIFQQKSARLVVVPAGHKWLFQKLTSMLLNYSIQQKWMKYHPNIVLKAVPVWHPNKIHTKQNLYEHILTLFYLFEVGSVMSP